MKPYPKYKDSGVEWIGDVPEHWSALRLKWVCNFLYGESLSAQEREDGTIPVYGSNGIVGYHNRSITEKPCIIVGRKGSFGKVTFSEKKCYPIDTTYYIDCTSTKNYMRWLWYLLPLLKMDEFSRDSAVPGLNREDAYRNIVTLPPSYEQQQIAAYLDRKTTQIDNLISKKQKLIELLKEERSAIINQAVTKGLNPDAPMKASGIEWQGKVPEKWEVKRLKFLANKVGSGVTPRGGASVYQKDGIPLLRSQNIHFEGLKLDDVAYISEQIHNEMSGSKVKPKDVLLNITGASIGRCCIVPSDFGEANVNQHVCIIRPNRQIESGFLHNYISSDNGQVQIFSSEKGISREGLNFEQLKGFQVLLPPIGDQKDIKDYIESATTKIDQTISNIEKQIDLLQEYRTALISEVVTGKVDVRDEGSK